MILRIEPPEGLHVFRHEAMATEFVFSIGGVDRVYASQLALELGRVVDDIESKLSLYRESSDVSRINLAPVGARVRVSEACVACLDTALGASSLTDGLFNVFLGAEACRAKGSLPAHLSGFALGAALEGGAAALAVDSAGREVYKRIGGVALDLGGVGKGFALERAAELLEDWEAPLAMFSAGGSTLLFRCPAGERPWRASVGERLLSPFGVGALASSGLGFAKEHIIDPRSRESRTWWIRSYIHCLDAGMADALSTGLMLMDWERIEELAGGDAGLSVAVESATGEWREIGPLFEEER